MSEIKVLKCKKGTCHGIILLKSLILFLVGKILFYFHKEKVSREKFNIMIFFVMHFPTIIVYESLLTIITFEWFFSCMSEDVPL